MCNTVTTFVVLLLSLVLLGACGQTGPLFLPGNPSQIQTSPPIEHTIKETEDEDDPGINR